MVDGAPALEDVARIGAEMDHVRSGHRHLAIEFDTESPADAAAASVAAGEECAADRLDRAGLRIADLHRHAITILIDYALACGSEADGDHRVLDRKSTRLNSSH